MFIDVHVHTRKGPVPDRDGKPAYTSPDELIRRYDELGIERAVVLPSANPECAYAPQPTEDAIELAEEYDGRFIPFCNVDPRAMTNSPSAPLGDLLRHYRDRGCKGLGESAANLPFLHPLYQNLFRHLEEVGLPITFHVAAQIGGIYGIYDDPGLPQLDRTLLLFPDLKFFAHSQTFWAEMAPLAKPGDRYGYPSYPVEREGVVARLFREHPNLYGDLSANSGYNALRRDPEYAAKFLDEFQDRLMFGTDICAPGTPTPLVGFLIGLRDGGKISETVFNKVARDNAIRLLGLA